MSEQGKGDIGDRDGGEKREEIERRELGEGARVIWRREGDGGERGGNDDFGKFCVFVISSRTSILLSMRCP